MQQVTVASFGYGHGEPPEAHIVLDLRRHFRDPHVRPELRHLTAADQQVVSAVLGTSGIRELVDATVAMVRAYLAGPTPAPLTVAVGCVGGRHRSAVVASAITVSLQQDGVETQLTNRDLTRPVITR